jgi:hypothetical protein
VAVALPLTTTNSGGPVGTLQRNRKLGPHGRPLHFVDHSVNSKCWLLVDVDRPTAKLAISGIVTFDEVPLLQLTLRLASSLQRSKLTTQLEFTYLGAQCWRMWLHACCFAVA